MVIPSGAEAPALNALIPVLVDPGIGDAGKMGPEAALGGGFGAFVRTSMCSHPVLPNQSRTKYKT